MIFSIDRVQYSRTLDKYFIFEFLQISNIKELLTPDGNIIFHGNWKFWDKLYGMVIEPVKEKLVFLMNWSTNATKIFIIYQKNIDVFIKIEMDLLNYQCSVMNFKLLKQWFRHLNNIDGDIYSSKPLGSSRDLNVDNYVIGLLRHLYCDNKFIDDNGLELTKKLLSGDSTTAIDFDLFQYIPSTNEYIIYEFLKRDSNYVNNITAHPMRYSWTEKDKNNKQKFISFWKAKNYFNARLFLINYSNNFDEKVSIIEVIALDENIGFIEERKYVMSQNIFIAWLKDMYNYKKNHNDYLSDFKCVNYDYDFFKKYHSKKFDFDKQYGKEFKN